MSADLKKSIQREQELSRLKEANRNLLIRLDRKTAHARDLVAAVYRSVRDAMTAIDIPRVPAPPLKTTSKHTPETAVALLSDLQLGKRTPTYSSAVCARRVKQFGDKIRELTQIQRQDHPVDELHVHMLGDMIEGELIFPGQEHRIDASLYRQVVVDGPQILVNFLRSQLTVFKKIHVACVIGNHGAIGGRERRSMHPESNADLMLYTITRMLLEGEPRITWDIPSLEGERAWYTIDTIGSKRFFLFHGDQMTGGGFAGLPYYGFGRAVNNWAAGVIPGSFHYAVAGHWHQPASIPVNDRILWVNGSTESSNEWLREELKRQGPPSQWLLFSHPRNGVTAEYKVWLS